MDTKVKIDNTVLKDVVKFVHPDLDCRILDNTTMAVKIALTSKSRTIDGKYIPLSMMNHLDKDNGQFPIDTNAIAELYFSKINKECPYGDKVKTGYVLSRKIGDSLASPIKDENDNLTIFTNIEDFEKYKYLHSEEDLTYFKCNVI